MSAAFVIASCTSTGNNTQAGETTGSSEVSATISATTQTVPLSWTATANATGYKVYRSTVSGGESTSPALIATIASGSTTSYTDTGTAAASGSVPASNTTFVGRRPVPSCRRRAA